MPRRRAPGHLGLALQRGWSDVESPHGQVVRNGHPDVANSPSSIAVACQVSTLPGPSGQTRSGTNRKGDQKAALCARSVLAATRRASTTTCGINRTTGYPCTHGLEVQCPRMLHLCLQNRVCSLTLYICAKTVTMRITTRNSLSKPETVSQPED